MTKLVCMISSKKACSMSSSLHSVLVVWQEQVEAVEQTKARQQVTNDTGTMFTGEGNQYRIAVMSGTKWWCGSWRMTAGSQAWPILPFSCQWVNSHINCTEDQLSFAKLLTVTSPLLTKRAPTLSMLRVRTWVSVRTFGVGLQLVK